MFSGFSVCCFTHVPHKAILHYSCIFAQLKVFFFLFVFREEFSQKAVVLFYVKYFDCVVAKIPQR